MTIGRIERGSASIYSVYGYLRDWSGSDDPNKKRVNPYTLIEREHKQSEFCTTYPYPYGNTCGPLVGLSEAHLGWDANDENRLLDKLFSKMRGHEFSAGVFIGQSRETATQVVNATAALSRSYKSLKRGDLKGVLRGLPRSISASNVRTAKRRLSSGDVAGTWLSIQYGWLPIYHDVAAACAAFEVMSTPRRSWEITVTRGKRGIVETSQSPTLYEAPAVATHSQRLRYWMEEDIAYERRMGLTDVSSIVWELVPWSFVVDWFVPIGTYLSNLSMAPLIKGTVYRTTKEGCYTVGVAAVNPAYSEANGQFAYYSFSRDGGSTSLSVPRPSFKGLDVLWSSAKRIANATALMASVFTPDPTYDTWTKSGQNIFSSDRSQMRNPALLKKIGLR